MAAARRGSVFGVVLASAGTADHDHVFLDRDLDGAVTRPVLGVHGIVLHGGIQPQAVSLFAVVESALERARGPGTTARTPTAAARRTLGFLCFFGLRGGCSNKSSGLLFGGVACCLFGRTCFFFCLRGGFRFEFGGDLRVIFRAQVNLFRSPAVLFE